MLRDDLTPLPPEFMPVWNQVSTEQHGHCLVCPAPLTILGVWDNGHGKRIPYGLCAEHAGSADVALRNIETRLAEPVKLIPPSPSGPAGYARALEEQLAFLRWMDSEDARRGCLRLLGKIAADDEPTDDMLAQNLPRLGATIGRCFLQGEPFFWSRAMCRLLVDVAATVPDSWTPEPSTFLTQYAFTWFAEPLPLPVWTHKPVTALTWAHDGHPDRTIMACVTMFTCDPSRPAGLPTHYLQWPRGRTIGEESFDLSHMRAENTDRARAKLRYIAAMFALLEQHIVVHDHQRADRASRRRFAAAGMKQDPVVRVVRLRRAEAHARPESPGEPVEWSCQWIVKGHWRMQWCPSIAKHRPLWILPHVKGPEDKPLKAPSTRLFAVVR